MNEIAQVIKIAALFWLSQKSEVFDLYDFTFVESRIAQQ